MTKKTDPNKVSEIQLSYQLEIQNDFSQAKPFLRWAGGKSRITKFLKKYVPPKFGRYWEPFLGSGALYFSIRPLSAYLSDSNADLINCYRFVRDFPEEIFLDLQNHAKQTSQDYYYSVREIYNNSQPSIEQAARFIYLNKTSFNGIFRVNRSGKYNVPYGHKDPPSLPTLEQLKSVSELLKHAELEAHTFLSISENEKMKVNDFVYLDPPYPPLNGTSNFTHYTPEKFSWDDQEMVSTLAHKLGEKGALVMVSNSDVPKVRKLYVGWIFKSLPVVRWVAANGTRHKVNELIVMNYDVE